MSHTLLARQAVHRRFWCGIACLAALGWWTPSLGQTVGSSSYFFKGYPVDGSYPVGGTLVDRTNPHVVYGTTTAGGAYNAGEVYRLSGAPGGVLHSKIIYSFKGDPDIGTPTGRLYQDASGALYGGCIAGGQPLVNSGGIFKLTPPATGVGEWTETILHVFPGNDTSTNVNVSGLVADTYGNLYGTAFIGRGLIFQIRPDGTYRNVHLFEGFPDGQGPTSPLTMGPNGVLYGVTQYGGTHSCGGYGCGAIYALTPRDKDSLPVFRPVFGFDEGEGGHAPTGPVAVDPSGAIYGSNTRLHAYSGGTMFKVTPAHDYLPATVAAVYSFTGSQYPFNGAALDGAGDIYGVYSKEFGNSTYVFELQPTAPDSYGPSKLVPLLDMHGGGFHTDGVTLTPDAHGKIILDDIVEQSSAQHALNGAEFRLLVQPAKPLPGQPVTPR